MRVVFCPHIFNFRRCISINEILVNDQIREKEVRVVSENGEQLGIMPTKNALLLAEEKNLDLCLIAPKAAPPVCKIMDYGKYRYEMQKREKEAKKNQKVIELHEIQLSVTIEEHDMAVKAKKAREFLLDGNRVKVAIRFRSRQIAHPEIGMEVMNKFFNMLADVAKMEKKPVRAGRNLTMILVSQ